MKDLQETLDGILGDIESLKNKTPESTTPTEPTDLSNIEASISELEDKIKDLVSNAELTATLQKALEGKLTSKYIENLVTTTDLQNALKDIQKQIIITISTNGHAYVDLGLPSGTLWATCNIGATSPSEYGNYYAWGEIIGCDKNKMSNKDYFSWDTYKWGLENNLTKYNKSDGKTELEDGDDVAHTEWGGQWKMPTYTQMEELKDKCEWKWQTNYNGLGVKGYIVKSKTNSNFIFLPAAGRRSDNKPLNTNDKGYYWQRTIYRFDMNKISLLRYDNYYIEFLLQDRYYGCTVRAVCLPASE